MTEQDSAYRSYSTCDGSKLMSTCLRVFLAIFSHMQTMCVVLERLEDFRGRKAPVLHQDFCSARPSSLPPHAYNRKFAHIARDHLAIPSI